MVLQPGVCISSRVIAAAKFVANCTAPQVDWQKLLRPDEQDLVEHPWFKLYFKPSYESSPDPTLAFKEEATVSIRNLESITEVEESNEGSDDSASHTERRFPITVPAQPLTVVPTSTSANSSCNSCVGRRVACTPQPGLRCLQCKKSKIKCSHAQAKFISYAARTRKPATHDSAPVTMEIGGKLSPSLNVTKKPHYSCPSPSRSTTTIDTHISPHRCALYLKGRPRRPDRRVQ